MKFAESNAINKCIEHIETKEKDGNVYQYHISNLYNKTMAVNYYCADTSRFGRINKDYFPLFPSFSDIIFIS